MALNDFAWGSDQHEEKALLELIQAELIHSGGIGPAPGSIPIVRATHRVHE